MQREKKCLENASWKVFKPAFSAPYEPGFQRNRLKS